MATNDKNFGVISEQGFVTEKTNLGFKPVTEQERADIEKYFEDKYHGDKSKKNK